MYCKSRNEWQRRCLQAVRAAATGSQSRSDLIEVVHLFLLRIHVHFSDVQSHRRALLEVFIIYVNELFHVRVVRQEPMRTCTHPNTRTYKKCHMKVS